MAATTLLRNQAEAPIVLTIDAGSSSARVLLYDRRGRSVDGIGERILYDVQASQPGAAEFEVDRLLAQIARAVDAALEQAGPLTTQIAAVAVDTFVTSLVAVDAYGEPLTPLMTYADTRSGEDALLLRSTLDEQAVHERTGCLLRTSYWPARLAWYRRTRPELWKQVARWLTLGEYLELRLFGCCRASYSAASWSGLLDRHQLVWDGPLLSSLGVAPGQLSPLVDRDAALCGLLPPYADRWPPLRQVPWFPALGDGAAANVGSGCSGPSRIALTLGTTGALRKILAAGQAPPVPPGLWSYRVDRSHHLVGGATSEGGNVYAWARRSLALGDPAQIEAALAALPADSHGLTVLPFFAGERSPNWAGNVQATLHGLTLATTPLEILRAALESVAYRFALIEQRLCGDLGSGLGSDYRLIASGGALHQSPAWSQIFADVLGRPVVLSAEAEATSRGSALLALHALGAIDHLDELPATDGACFLPDAARHSLYQAAIERQHRLYQQLIA